MIQLVPFDPSKAGNTPNMCLDNVHKGYGIGNKYSSAWQAWLHTEQHPDWKIPNGLDVPLYYSYIATLDGVTENYGHINVRLADGRVWSDGNYYASLDVYLANHSLEYVGWGESVNDVKVVEGDNMNNSVERVKAVFMAYLFREATAKEIAYWVLRPCTELDDNAASTRFAIDAKTIADLKAQAQYVPVTETLYRKK